jgi:hypothetical protein
VALSSAFSSSEIFGWFPPSNAVHVLCPEREEVPWKGAQLPHSVRLLLLSSLLRRSNCARWHDPNAAHIPVDNLEVFTKVNTQRTHSSF